VLDHIPLPLVEEEGKPPASPPARHSSSKEKKGAFVSPKRRERPLKSDHDLQYLSNLWERGEKKIVASFPSAIREKRGGRVTRDARRETLVFQMTPALSSGRKGKKAYAAHGGREEEE